MSDEDIWVLANDIALVHHRRSWFAGKDLAAKIRLRTAIANALMAERAAWSAIVSRDADLLQKLMGVAT